MAHGTGLGAEHPLNDTVQSVFLIVYLVVWGLDSFVFHLSTVLDEVVPVFIRFPLGLLSIAVGTYLALKSEAIVFGRDVGDRKLITTGVYAYVRHPMYLGLLLVLLGWSLTTLSLLSLLVWAGLFIFLDRMATYEERDLCRIAGEQYLDYQKRVVKRIPHVT